MFYKHYSKVSDLLLSVLFFSTVQNESINVIVMICSYMLFQTYQLDESTNKSFSSLYMCLTMYCKCLDHSGKQEEDRGWP